MFISDFFRLGGRVEERVNCLSDALRRVLDVFARVLGERCVAIFVVECSVQRHQRLLKFLAQLLAGQRVRYRVSPLVFRVLLELASEPGKAILENLRAEIWKLKIVLFFNHSAFVSAEMYFVRTF